MSFDPITAGLEFVGKIADKIWPDPTAKAEGLLRLEQLKQTGELAVLAAETELAKGQLAINAEEAKSESLFVAGWRPFVGWVCGAAFAYTFVLQPFMVFIAAISGSTFDFSKLPVLDWSQLGFVLAGMLGLGGMRSFDKYKGVSK